MVNYFFFGGEPRPSVDITTLYDLDWSSVEQPKAEPCKELEDIYSCDWSSVEQPKAEPCGERKYIYSCDVTDA